MNTFVILYHYAPDSQKILEIRPQHREFLKALKDERKLIGSGPFTDGQGGALIVIRLPEPATAEDAAELMDRDPFHTGGAISARTIHSWDPVLNVFN